MTFDHVNITTAHKLNSICIGISYTIEIRRKYFVWQAQMHYPVFNSLSLQN